jgi:ribosome recycling factor
MERMWVHSFSRRFIMASKKSLEERIESTKAFLKEELNTVRAGRANPALLDRIMVNYYGTPTPLKSLANISVPDPRTLMISPFDPKSVSDIERAINEANIGINPANDGKVIRLAIPQLTEERRKELTKVVKGYGEDAKVAVRNLRREENDELKKMQKDGDLTEDDLKSELEETQKKVEKAIKDVDGIIDDKVKELMEV